MGSADPYGEVALALQLLGQMTVSQYPQSGQYLSSQQGIERTQSHIANAYAKQEAKKQAKKQKKSGLGGMLGGAGGSAAGMGIGAALGSIVPGVGTAIGAMIGGTLGGTVGGAVGSGGEPSGAEAGVGIGSAMTSLAAPFMSTKVASSFPEMQTGKQLGIGSKDNMPLNSKLSLGRAPTETVPLSSASKIKNPLGAYEEWEW
jgi:hypothetical protein